jgi:hypothetical protein
MTAIGKVRAIFPLLPTVERPFRLSAPMIQMNEWTCRPAPSDMRQRVGSVRAHAERLFEGRHLDPRIARAFR